VQRLYKSFGVKRLTADSNMLFLKGCMFQLLVIFRPVFYTKIAS